MGGDDAGGEAAVEAMTEAQLVAMGLPCLVGRCERSPWWARVAVGVLPRRA